MILKIVTNTRQIEGDGDVELFQQCSGTKPGELKKLGRVQSSSSNDDFSCSIHCLTWCSSVGGELLRFSHVISDTIQYLPRLQ